MTGLPYDLQHDLITIEQAAELANVSPRVVRNWISRGYRDNRTGEWQYLRAQRRPTVVNGQRAVRVLVVPIDVLRAEAATRRRARRNVHRSV